MTDERPEAIAGVADVDMSGRTVLVTGSTSGIGREAALAFGRLGAYVLVHGRDKQRGISVVERIERTNADGAAFYPADFADLAAVRDLASTLRAEVDALDVLVNNAGGLFPDGGTTVDGIERTFAVNHLAAFALTADLVPLLDTEGRVVTVASELHRCSDPPSLPEVRQPERKSPLRAYCRAKLANVLFTRELARRFEAAGVDATANCLHPGVIPGNWPEGLPLSLRLAAEAASALPAVLVEQFTADATEGAATPVFLGASPSVADANGAYFADCQRRTSSRTARSDRAARRLWALSEHLTGIDAAFGDGTEGVESGE